MIQIAFYKHLKTVLAKITVLLVWLSVDFSFLWKILYWPKTNHDGGF
jgi:hypothetical protein